jgi:catechol 2,3-dioxygenase-like lactoylglutathione lyase family enzyme
MLHHIALRTNSPSELAAFYVRVCGLALWPDAPANASGIWLGAGSTVVMIETKSASEPDPASGTMDLLAFQAQQTDINAVLAFLVEQRVAAEASTAFTAYFRDPDGRRIALSTYPFATARLAVHER